MASYQNAQYFSGLEVYHETGPEIDTRNETASGLHVTQLENNWHQHDPKFEKVHYNTLDLPSTPVKKRLNRKRLLIIGALLLCAIIGGIVGGVLASKEKSASMPSTSSSSSSSSSPSSSSPSSTSLASQAPDLQYIRSTSQLAVAGWQDESTGNYRIRLFYQGPDNYLRCSIYASNETWQDPLTLDSLNKVAMDKTPLAAAVSLESPVEYKLTYIDDSSILRAQGYDDYVGAPAQGKETFVNDKNWPVSSSTRIASYWPFIVVQNLNNRLQWIARGQDYQPTWSNDTMYVQGTTSSSMAAIPVSASYFGEAGVIYRRSDGILVGALEYNVTDEFWNPPDELNIAIPAASPIAAFAVARQDSANNETNTYILYTNDSGTIQMIWQDDSTGWKGPETYDAFDGADSGTDITCLTPGVWGRTGPAVEILSTYDLSRCYFQVGSYVREVHYNGSDWINVGLLPIN